MQRVVYGTEIRIVKIDDSSVAVVGLVGSDADAEKNGFEAALVGDE